MDLAFLAFGTAFDPIGVQPGKIPCQPADEALFFDHFSLRARLRQAGKISNVSERNFHVGAVAANQNSHRALRIGRNLLDGFIHNRTHPLNVLRRKVPFARLLKGEIVKGFCGRWRSVLPHLQLSVAHVPNKKTALTKTEVITANVISESVNWGVQGGSDL